MRVVYADDRPRRRDLECVAAGSLMGAALGTLVGALLPHPIFLTVLGALVGSVLGRSIAGGVSAEEWDPRVARSFVGAQSPDDDIASERWPLT